jgi:hypothetical protein
MWGISQSWMIANVSTIYCYIASEENTSNSVRGKTEEIPTPHKSW